MVALCLLALNWSAPVHTQGKAKPYAGAAILSKETFSYGRYEVRLKSAKGSGIVSAFFLRASRKTSGGTLVHELDFEFMGKSDRLLHMACHRGLDAPAQGKKHKKSKKNVQLPFDPSADFHTYALEYTPKGIVWFADGQEIWRLGEDVASEFFGVDMDIRCNIWTPNIKAWAGTVESDRLPVQYEIDYISYAKQTGNSQTFEVQWKDDFDRFDASRWSKAGWTWNANLAQMKPANVSARDGKVVLLLRENN